LEKGCTVLEDRKQQMGSFQGNAKKCCHCCKECSPWALPSWGWVQKSLSTGHCVHGFVGSLYCGHDAAFAFVDVLSTACEEGYIEEEQINASYTDGKQSQDRTK
jgi:hypothetical protein